MDLEEFRAAHPPKPTLIEGEEPKCAEKMTIMGPNPRRITPAQNMANLDAGLCPVCQAMVKEVAPNTKMDFRIVYYVCVENKDHRFMRPDLTRIEPSQIQKEAWAAM